MADIVVLGAGLGGVLMAYEMREAARPEDRVIVVSDCDTYHFVPSNPWVAVEWRSRADIAVPLAPVFARKGITLIAQAATGLDPAAKRLTLADGRSVSYDYLIIATGPELAFDEIPGFGPQGHTQSICHIDHAETAAQAWAAFVKAPGPIVVGAVQGASCFGPAYEFAFIMDTDLRRRKIRDRVPITFVTPEPYIGHLGLDGVGDTKTMLESALRDRHIKWITNAKVDAITADGVHVTEVGEDGSARATQVVASRYTMMLPAFRGIAPLQGHDGLVNPRGFVLVDKHQRNPRHRDIFAVGVAVAIPPVGKTPLPVGVPKTGFMIESMVTAVAKNIGAELRGETQRYEPTWNAVCLADFGDEGVAFVAQPQIPPRNVNWSSRGTWVHYAKIGFERYFLGKIRRGTSEPFYERLALHALGITKLKELTPSS